MLQHVGIEVRPEDVERSVEFWRLAGFKQVEPPESLAEFTWMQREKTQIHLMPTPSPTVPAQGHVAIVVPDFEAALGRLAAAGFEVERRREYWGAPRSKALAPGGHVVELLKAPPQT